MVASGFLKESHRSMVIVETDPDALLRRFSSYRPPDTPKWIKPSET
jgi:predicted Rossmann-fold nucleotide-binding protein